MSADLTVPKGSPRLLLLWGKLGANGTFHPALFHMLDVGHVARLLLSASGPPRFRSVMSAALSADPTRLEDWLPLLVALHDIGKVSNPFQAQDTKPQTRAARLRLTNQGFAFGSTHGHSYPHQQISAVWAQEVWPYLESGLPASLARAERDALGGHHGVFAPPNELTEVRKYLRREEPTEWAALREEVYIALRGVLAFDHCAWPNPRHRRAATMALAGFTILCDWIGSDAAHFPCEPMLSLDEYIPESAQRAEAALVSIGFLPARRRARYGGFRSLFPGITDPNPLQVAIDQLPARLLVWPNLFIIEAPTGEGKTEAALALAARLAEVGPSDELYFGLPTQATSNQMFGRVRAFLDSQTSGNSAVKLVHGQSYLLEDDLELRLLDDADSGGGALVSEWFAPKKRALLAPFGVGTVDQVELTTLSARHYMLRMFGLAGKAVIIDEVHAYDTYMSTILEEAISWLAALGSSIILLSATLPTSRHRALADAYHRALPQGTRPPVPSGPLPYPSLAVYTPHETRLDGPTAQQRNRGLDIRFVADDSIEAQSTRLLNLVHDGGAVCRICNTVAAAQDVFEVLRRMDPSVNLRLIHSRFPLRQRHEIEVQLSVGFGPNSTRSVHERAIVVGTQVLEQSLDLDFDAMVSDHAPIDLLLQRAGRLHRHKRKRSLSLARTELQVLLQVSPDGRPDFGVWAYVYDPYVLWTSWLALQSRLDQGFGQLVLPADYRPLIEAAYPEHPVALPPDSQFAVEIHAAHREHLIEERRMKDEARLRLSPEPSPDLGITEGTVLRLTEEEEGVRQGWGSASTRLGAQSATLIPLYRAGDGFALDVERRELVPSVCDRAMQLQLLRGSVPITISAARRPLLQRWEADRAALSRIFRKDSLLRHALPLILDGNRQLNGQYVLRLDRDLGLVIRKDAE